MADPTFSITFRTTCRDQWHIRPNQVLAAVKSPDRVELVQVDELKLRATATRIAGEPIVWLTVLEHLEPPPHEIDFAIRIYEGADPDFSMKPPLEMLRSLIEEIGPTAQIGTKRGKFLLYEKAQVAGSVQNMLSLIGAPKDDYAAIMHLKVEDGPPVTAEIALGFVVGVNAYKRYVAQHEGA
jgi:hypothetical protein